MKTKLLVLLILTSTLSLGQNQGNNWYFGYYAGLSFNGGTPTVLTDSKLQTTEGCASVSDDNGNLLFYTDGRRVWDSSHTTMNDGTGVFLTGNSSATQSAVVCPKPCTYNKTLNRFDNYYIITVDVTGGSNGVRFTEIDMTLNAGLGGIVTTQKNIHLYDTTTNESITVAKHANGNDYWIIGKEVGNTTYNAFLITSTGVNLTPVKSYVGPAFGVQIGSLKVSRDGTMVALGGTGATTRVLNFDNATGILTPRFYDPRSSGYSVEFSPDGNYLYRTSLNDENIYQYDLNAPDSLSFLASRTIIGTTNNTAHPYHVGALQIGPDDKIYVCLMDTNSLGVINNPNVGGVGANYVDHAIVFPPTIDDGYTIQVRLGLPNFPSFFSETTEDTLISNIVCLNDSSSFYTTDTSNVLAMEWLWYSLGATNKGGTKSTLYRPKFKFPSTGDYVVEAISTYPCSSDTLKDTISIFGAPFSIEADSSFCGGAINYTVNGPTTFDSLVWKDQFNTKLNNSFSYTFTDTGIYYVKAYDGSCFGVDTITLTRYVDPIADFESDSTCFGEQINLVNQSSVSSGTLTHLWLIDNTTYTTTNVSHVMSTSGVDSVTLIASTVDGCTDSVTKVVQTYELPVANYDRDSVCLGDSARLFNQSTSTTGFTSTWTIDGTTNTNTDLAYLFSSPGIYDVKLAIETPNGCEDSIIQTVKIFDLPVADFTYTDHCEGTPHTFTSTTTLNGAPTNTLVYLWSYGDGNISTQDEPVYTYDSVGTYQANVIAITLEGCVDDTTHTIQVFENPVADFSFVEACYGSPIELIDSSTIPSGNISVYNWSIDGVVMYDIPNTSHITQNDGIHDVKLLVTSDNGCSDSVTYIVETYTKPTASFIYTPSDVDIYTNTICFDNLSLNHDSSFWNFEFGNQFDTSDNPCVSLLSDPNTSYQVELIVKTDQNCVDTAYQDIFVKSAYNNYVPNAFSPNGDGINDEFSPIQTDEDFYDGYEFIIFDRWGGEIFRTDNIEKKWDGKADGEVLPTGNYIWKFSYENVLNEAVERIGTVTLIQ